MAPREVSHTPHRALVWAAVGAALFQVGDQAAEIWDRSLEPVQMIASSPDPLRVLFPQNVCQSVGPTHREGQGFLIPRIYAQADLCPRPRD